MIKIQEIPTYHDHCPNGLEIPTYHDHCPNGFSLSLSLSLSVALLSPSTLLSPQFNTNRTSTTGVCAHSLFLRRRLNGKSTRPPPPPNTEGGLSVRLSLADVASSSVTAVLCFSLAESTGYSLASYYTSLGLFVISVPGVWSLIKRSIKSKIVQKTFVRDGVEEKSKEPSQVAGEILSFFTRNNFTVADRGEIVTGVYYWTRASRKEEIKVKMILANDGKLSEILVQGDDEQIESMRKGAQFHGERDGIRKGYP